MKHKNLHHRSGRRSFIGQCGILSAGLSLGFHRDSVQAADSTSSLEKLNIAGIGTQGRAASNVSGVADQNMVALVDTSQSCLEVAAEKYPHARQYRDFRVMLEKEGDNIDAVVVSTADHTHAPAAAMAMRMKKHVYCEKPLTHTVYEARTLAHLAQENNLVTQLGTQIHAGNNYRRVVELIQAGAIGEVREVHVWVGANYSNRRLVTNRTMPQDIAWDLWLGPSPERTYCECIDTEGKVMPLHRFNWRWFWDYGTGGLGDFGCHFIDLVHWALDLKHPTRIVAKGPEPFLMSTTGGIEVTYEYPARGKLPPVMMKWYDGGKKPAMLKTLKKGQESLENFSGGQLFVGSEGMLLSNYHEHHLLPEEKFADFERPDHSIPSSIGHHKEWVEAIKNGGTTTCNFDYSGALTEAVLLGVASYRSGEPIEWDAENLRVTNSEKAQQFIHKEYRKGWTL